MSRRGHHIIYYIDDYLGLDPSFAECQRVMELITVLGNFGFTISWKKCASLSRQVKYLGLTFDSVTMTISLPSDKMLKLHNLRGYVITYTRRGMVAWVTGISLH